MISNEQNRTAGLEGSRLCVTQMSLNHIGFGSRLVEGAFCSLDYLRMLKLVTNTMIKRISRCQGSSPSPLAFKQLSFILVQAHTISRFIQTV